MAKITYLPGEVVNASVDENGNRLPVTRTQHIFDDTMNKPQSQVNEETAEAISDEVTRSQNAESGLDTRLHTVEELAEISVGGGDIGIGTAADFESDDPEDLAKVPTVGAMLGGANDGVYDISARHSGTKYADLAAALGTNGINVPVGVRKGGMSVKFVQSSDNKYVQFRFLLSGSFTAAQFGNKDNWRSAESVCGYFVCSTVGANSNKSVTIPGYILQNGGCAKIKFEHATTTSSANLNISVTGNKPLYYNGRPASLNNTWSDNEVVEVYYDGDSYYASTVANKNKELSANIGYFVCSSASGSSIKSITETERKFNLIVGGCFKVKFENVVGNVAEANLDFNFNVDFRKPLFYEGARASRDNSWEAGEVVEIYYDGENYQAHKISYKSYKDDIDAADAKIKENTINTISQTVASVAGSAYSNIINNVGIKAGDLVKCTANVYDLVNPADNRKLYIRLNSTEVALLYSTQEYVYFVAPFDMPNIMAYMSSNYVSKSNDITFSVTNYGNTASAALKFANNVTEASIVPIDVNANLSLNVWCDLKTGEPFVVVIEDADESIDNRTVNVRYIPTGGSLTIIEELKNKNRLSQIHRFDEDVSYLNIGVTKDSSAYNSGTFKIKIYKFSTDNVIIPLIERAEKGRGSSKNVVVSIDNPYWSQSWEGNIQTELERHIKGIYYRFDSISFYDGENYIIKTWNDCVTDLNKTPSRSEEWIPDCLYLTTNSADTYHQALAFNLDTKKFIQITDTVPTEENLIILAYQKHGNWCGPICDQYNAKMLNNQKPYITEVRRDYLGTIRTKEMELLGAKNYFTFGLCSDVHYMMTEDNGTPINVTNAVMNDIDNYIGLDAILNGGDDIIYGTLIKQHGLDALRKEFQTINLDKFVPCVGNHDYNGHGSPYIQEDDWTITDKELETLYFRRCKTTYRPDGKLYYYRDFDDKKVRIIVLNTQDVPIEFNEQGEIVYDPLTIFGFSQQQVNFIVSALDVSSKADAASWKIIFLMHVGLYTNAEGMLGNGVIANRVAIRGILNAFVNRTTYDYSYTDSEHDGIFTISGSVDFSSAVGKLVAVFNGHTHHDLYVNSDGFNCIGIQCSYPFNLGSAETASSLPDMTPGTYKEFAIDAVILDDVQQKIILKRFGCHHSIQNPDGDREYSYDVTI